MSGSIQHLFERWQRTGDPAALGAIFDACAGDLLRLAVHLVGDAARAEDLVQETFLAAIAQREQLDTSRPLEPWLGGVLTRKARATRRADARTPDPREVLARAERSPLDAAIEREFGGELATALDRLREPYRSVLVLRLRHGLAPADIAHALERSPGAVRVQLHRGLEELRRSLPAGIAGAALLGIAAPRGLASVRTATLEAATKNAPWVAPTLAGGVLVTKKLVLGGLVAASVAAWIWIARAPAPTASTEPEPLAVVEVAAIEAPEVRAASTPEVAAVELDERVAAPTPESLPARIAGRVVDARSGKALPGARLRLFPARTGSIHDLAVAQGPDTRHGPDGSPQVPHGSLPLVLSARDHEPLARDLESMQVNLGLELVRIYDAPTPDELALSEVLSDPKGRFELAAPHLGGVVVVEHEGFARRTFAAPHPEGRWTVGLHPAWILRGVVVDPLGEAVREPLRLSFSPNADQSLMRDFGSPTEFTRASVAEAPWTCESRADGSFEVELGSGAVRPNVLTPGWVTVNQGVHPLTREGWVFDQQFTPDEAGDTAWVVARGMPLLEVRDARTKLAIEELSITAFESSQGFPRTCGRFHAPGGRVTLAYDVSPTEPGSIGGCRVAVGAPGYRSAEVLVTNSGAAERHLVELEPGGDEVVRGWVLDAGAPVADALVTLGPWRKGWQAGETSAVDAVRTGPDGVFELQGLSGRWVVHARSEERLLARALELPAGEVRLDLADPTGFVVRVLDENGEPRAGHSVHFFERAGRTAKCESDENGIARISGLEPGSWQVATSRVVGDGPRMLDVIVKCDLAPNERREVELRAPLPDTDARYRLVLASGASTVGWRARFTTSAWEDVAPDGTLEPAEDGARLNVQVAAPDGRLWERSLDPRQPIGDLPLDPEGPGYAGVLRRADDGTPLAGVRVSASSSDAAWNWHRMSSPTDAQGRFHVQALPGTRWRLTFERDGDRTGTWSADATFAGLTFLPESAPGVPPTALEVRLPLRHRSGGGGVETANVRGRVVGPDGEALADQVVLLTCIEPQRDGHLEIDYGSSHVRTSSEGRFSVQLPVASVVEVRVIDAHHKELLQETWDRAAFASGEERLLRLP